MCKVDFQMSPLERISCCADVAGDGVGWCEPHPREIKVVLTLHERKLALMTADTYRLGTGTLPSGNR